MIISEIAGLTGQYYEWGVQCAHNCTKSYKLTRTSGLGVSAISCWEVAKLVELGRLELTHPITERIEEALAYPGVRLLELTPRIAIESTQLPGEFHRDPADQIIVATARIYSIPLLTIDSRISSYSHVTTLPDTNT